MFLRYLYLHKRSLARSLEIIFWPVMSLMLWGFLTLYVQKLVTSDMSRVVVFLISAMIFWDILYRSQQGVTMSVIEDVWTQNIQNIFISPLKVWEWVSATFIYGIYKTFVITLVLTLLATVFYQFNMFERIGFYLIPLLANLVLFGWALGLMTSGFLIRFGHSVEALIWGVPFLIQPFSAIYYPLSTLPSWLQPLSLALPSTYVCEGMREVIKTGEFQWDYFYIPLSLNIIYFIVGSLIFNWMYKSARRTGRLGQLGLS